MKVISLQSGSNGNCIYVESEGVRLLVDAGISGRQAQLRLGTHGRDVAGIDALLISHDHRDHTRCMGVFQRRHKIPIHVTKETLSAAQLGVKVGKMARVHYFQSGATLRFGNITVETIPTPHDAADGVAFVIDDGKHRLGVLTDLGHVFDQLEAVVQTLDAVVIESNYDIDMLDSGPYPDSLKSRIKGPRGHLSNVDCAELLSRTNGRLRWACLAHLSEKNNDPQRALDTHHEILGKRLPLYVASRYEVGEILEV